MGIGATSSCSSGPCSLRCCTALRTVPWGTAFRPGSPWAAVLFSTGTNPYLQYKCLLVNIRSMQIKRPTINWRAATANTNFNALQAGVLYQSTVLHTPASRRVSNGGGSTDNWPAVGVPIAPHAEPASGSARLRCTGGVWW